MSETGEQVIESEGKKLEKKGFLGALFQIVLQKIQQNIYYGLSVEEMGQYLELKSEFADIRDETTSLVVSNCETVQSLHLSLVSLESRFDLIVNRIHEIKNLKIKRFADSEIYPNLPAILFDFVYLEIVLGNNPVVITERVIQIGEIIELLPSGNFSADKQNSTLKARIINLLNDLNGFKSSNYIEVKYCLARVFLSTLGDGNGIRDAITWIQNKKDKDGHHNFFELGEYLTGVWLELLEVNVENIPLISEAIFNFRDLDRKPLKNFLYTNAESIFDLYYIINESYNKKQISQKYYYIVYSYFRLCNFAKKVQEAEFAMNFILEKLWNIYEYEFLIDCGRLYFNLSPKNFDKEKCRELLLTAMVMTRNQLISTTDIRVKEKIENDQLIIKSMLKDLDGGDIRAGKIPPLKTH